ncbi:unnamed protein product [Prunus armeniaca]
MRACRSAREVSENSTHACLPFARKVVLVLKEGKNGEVDMSKCRRKWGVEGAWDPLCMGDTCQQGCEELRRFGSRC